MTRAELLKRLRELKPWLESGYTSVDPDVLWDVTQDSLLELVLELDALEAR